MYAILKLLADRGAESVYSLYTVEKEITEEKVVHHVDEITGLALPDTTEIVGTGKYETIVYKTNDLDEIEDMLVEAAKENPLGNLTVVKLVDTKVDFIFDPSDSGYISDKQ